MSNAEAAAASICVEFGCIVCGKRHARRCMRCLKEAFCSVECQRAGYAAHKLICETPESQHVRTPGIKDALASFNPFRAYISQHPDRLAKMKDLSSGFDSEQMIWLLLPDRVMVCEAESQQLQLHIGTGNKAAENMIQVHREKLAHCHSGIVVKGAGKWYMAVFSLMEE